MDFCTLRAGGCRELGTLLLNSHIYILLHVNTVYMKYYTLMSAVGRRTLTERLEPYITCFI